MKKYFNKMFMGSLLEKPQPIRTFQEKGYELRTVWFYTGFGFTGFRVLYSLQSYVFQKCC